MSKKSNHLQKESKPADTPHGPEYCVHCASHLIFNHYPCLETLSLQEISYCLECEGTNKKMLHPLH